MFYASLVLRGQLWGSKEIPCLRSFETWASLWTQPTSIGYMPIRTGHIDQIPSFAVFEGASFETIYLTAGSADAFIDGKLNEFG